MNKTEKDKLQEILKDNDDVVDNTEYIRENKCSEKIKFDIEKLIIFRNNNTELMNTDKNQYDELLKNECFYLYTNYPDIFSKLKDNQLDLKLMFQIIEIYKEIEDGKLDQHEASYKIGKILKEIYVDTALSNISAGNQPKNISYSDWAAKQR